MKKFTVSSDDLKKGLKKIGQAVNEKAILPVTKNIYCKVTKSEVELITTDLEITISYKCAIENVSDDPFELLLPFSFINSIIGNLKGEPVAIEHPSSRKAKVICGDDKFEINSLDKFEEFPKLPDTPKEKLIQLDANFIDLLSKCMLTVDKNEGRPAMMRALLDIKPGNTNLVSTDAHFLYKHKINIESGETTLIQFSAKMAKAIEGMEAIQLCWTEKQVALISDKLTVWCRMFDDRYPDYSKVIPEYGPNLFIEKAVLSDALHRACINTNATKQTFIHLKKETGFIHFETDDSEFGRKIFVKRPGVFNGETETISLNAKKLLTILDQVDADKIKMHIDLPSKAVLISTDEDTDYLGLIMPLIM